MKLSLQEVAAKIDKEFGKLSPVATTEQVIRNKFKNAGIKAQKRRTQDNWAKLLIKAGVMSRASEAVTIRAGAIQP